MINLQHYEFKPNQQARNGLRCQPASRWQATVVSGERRSANRSQWSIPREPESEMLNRAHTSPGLYKVLAEARKLQGRFMDMDATAAANLRRVQFAMQKHRVGPHCFAGSTGYGHGDIGRSTFDKVFGEVLGTEACMARVSMAGADHALSCALFGSLRPQDHVTFLTGRPDVSTRMLIQDCPGSLADWGISCSHVDLTADGMPDVRSYQQEFSVRPPRAVVLQRSPGLQPIMANSRRKFLSIQQLRNSLEAVTSCCGQHRPIFIVDNRHSEFVETEEPGSLGVDLVTGTLLSAVGGSIVPSGGYVAGRQTAVEKACSRLCAPGMSLDSGAVRGDTLRLMFQGLHLAPGTVSEARKGMLLVREFLMQEETTVSMDSGGHIDAPFTSIQLGSQAKMQAILDAVREVAPFHDSSAQNGAHNDEDVQHAGGSFIQGCVADIRVAGLMSDPFPCVLSGGLHWSQWANVLAQLR
eukprot:jgi/Ulvmu1/2763/UM014_0221.1